MIIEGEMFTLTAELKTRIVHNPPGCPFGTYVENMLFFAGNLISHEYLGPLDGGVAAMEVQDATTGDFKHRVLMIDSSLKRYVATPPATPGADSSGEEAERG